MKTNNFTEEVLAPTQLLKLHEILTWMVNAEKMESSEAIDILNRAGLRYDEVNKVWIDEMGAKYGINTDI